MKLSFFPVDEVDFIKSWSRFNFTELIIKVIIIP